MPPKVLPDFMVRKAEAGLDMSPQDQQSWAFFQSLFFSGVVRTTPLKKRGWKKAQHC